VADDPRSRRSPRRARPPGSFVCSVRPHCFPLSRRRRTVNTSPGLPISNHFRGREPRASFV
jgi:hypothetical protein